MLLQLRTLTIGQTVLAKVGIAASVKSKALNHLKYVSDHITCSDILVVYSDK